VKTRKNPWVSDGVALVDTIERGVPPTDFHDKQKAANKPSFQELADSAARPEDEHDAVPSST
jgi:hypothetical protein